MFITTVVFSIYFEYEVQHKTAYFFYFKEIYICFYRKPYKAFERNLMFNLSART